MREIKFRAWFHDPDSPTDGEMLDFETTFREGYVEPAVESLRPVDECTILMQYTGVKDKNGAEIYEGDIIKNYQADINEVFQDDDGSWCMRNHHASSLPLIDYAKNSEIIGNIYENPELLNDNKE